MSHIVRTLAIALLLPISACETPNMSARTVPASAAGQVARVPA